MRQTTGRRGQRAPRIVGAIQQRAWKQPVYRYRPAELLSADQIGAIHATALRILEEIGMKVLEPRARTYFGEAGAEIDESLLW